MNNNMYENFLVLYRMETSRLLSRLIQSSKLRKLQMENELQE